MYTSQQHWEDREFIANTEGFDEMKAVIDQFRTRVSEVTGSR
jgi:hypothetical protein